MTKRNNDNQLLHYRIKDAEEIKHLNDVLIEEKEIDGFKVKVLHKYVTDETIKSFRDNGLVKFIFFGKEYEDVSSDKDVNEIHKMKSKYRGNTYTRVPFCIVKKDDDKYVRGIEVSLDDKADGYAIMNNHDIWQDHRDMKNTTKDKRGKFASGICEEFIGYYNAILSNAIHELTIDTEDGAYIAFRQYGNNEFDIEQMVEEAKGYISSVLN